YYNQSNMKVIFTDKCILLSEIYKTTKMEKFPEFTTKLKNGKSVKIRQATIADAENLLQTIKTYIPQSTYIPKLIEEVKWTVSEMEAWIESFKNQDNSLLLVAEFENAIIGNIDLTGNQRKIMFHTAVIGMGILEEWQNCGLGTALLQAMKSWSKTNPFLELIWLQVYSDNIAGMQLYQKSGFTNCGIMKDFFKHTNQYFDKITMSLPVK
uniref:GNAT family N-acetyltransferase n=2 Tax=Flavobacterium sp. TaxID=239 RepID=UPI00404B8009